MSTQGKQFTIVMEYSSRYLRAFVFYTRISATKLCASYSAGVVTYTALCAFGVYVRALQRLWLSCVLVIRPCSSVIKTLWYGNHAADVSMNKSRQFTTPPVPWKNAARNTTAIRYSVRYMYGLYACGIRHNNLSHALYNCGIWESEVCRFCLYLSAVSHSFRLCILWCLQVGV